MTRDAAFLWSVLLPRAAGALGVLLLVALLAALLWSVLVPALTVPELSPTRWNSLGTHA